jgi:hypothetical protein
MVGHNANGAIDHALQEVQAARRDLTITGFCMRQAEALRRMDRARASLAYVLQSGTTGAQRPSHVGKSGKLLDSNLSTE